MGNTELTCRHQIRLNRAINYVHSLCDDTLSLDQLARVACMSKYHFARVFGDHVGESPIAFSSRIKLERAAYMLAFCRDWSITELADACGFASGQTFCRAFKRRFEFSPRDFREQHVFRVGGPETDHQLERAIASLCSQASESDSGTPDCSLIRVVQQPDIRVAYVRNLGSYGSRGTIPQAYRVITQWAKANGFSHPATQLIGVSWDNARITPERVCRYDACIPLSDHTQVPNDVSVQIIPGGLYAVIRTNPQLDEIPLIWESFLLLLKDWPGFKRLTLRVGRPYYEIYTARGLNGCATLDLYAPVSLNNFAGYCV